MGAAVAGAARLSPAVAISLAEPGLSFRKLTFKDRTTVLRQLTAKVGDVVRWRVDERGRLLVTPANGEQQRRLLGQRVLAGRHVQCSMEPTPGADFKIRSAAAAKTNDAPPPQAAAAADRHLPDAALRVDGRWVQPAARPPPRPPAPRPPPVQRPRKPTENERQRHRSEATPHDDEQAALLALYYRYKYYMDDYVRQPVSRSSLQMDQLITRIHTLQYRLATVHRVIEPFPGPRQLPWPSLGCQLKSTTSDHLLVAAGQRDWRVVSRVLIDVDPCSRAISGAAVDADRHATDEPTP